MLKDSSVNIQLLKVELFKIPLIHYLKTNRNNCSQQLICK